jgi:DNA-binding NarL/FixJ family response regulator
MDAKIKPKENVKSELFRVLIADDHGVVRRGIRSLLEGEPGLEVCGEAVDGFDAVDYVKKNRPELVILDLTMPGLNGLDALREIRESAPKTRVLILTMHFSEDVARAAFQAGAQGYLLKSDADLDLLSAVRLARNNKLFFTGKLAGFLVNSFVQQTSEVEPNELYPMRDIPLTGREIEILKLLANGMSNKQIAPTVGLSIRTVESHRTHIMHKMKFESFSAMIRFAIRHHLVEP